MRFEIAKSWEAIRIALTESDLEIKLDMVVN